MFLVSIGVGFFITSFILFLLTVFIPILRMILLDWIALILMFIPYIIVMYRLFNSRCLKQADRIPKWKHLMKYLRRDNETIEILGERAYPGESFVDVPLLGLIEYIGRDCYYNSGDKKYAWVLENMNFTPDPRYGNLTHVLWSLGFTNSDEVRKVLKGELPELRDKVHENMKEWDNGHGVNKLTEELENYDDKKIVFEPVKKVEDKHNKAIDMIDKMSHIKFNRNPGKEEKH